MDLKVGDKMFDKNNNYVGVIKEWDFYGIGDPTLCLFTITNLIYPISEIVWDEYHKETV